MMEITKYVPACTEEAAARVLFSYDETKLYSDHRKDAVQSNEEYLKQFRQFYPETYQLFEIKISIRPLKETA